MSNPSRTRVELSGNEVVVTDAERAAVIWRLQRFSSVTYLRRIYGIYVNFIDGYEAYVRERHNDDPDFREVVRFLLSYQVDLKRGIELVERGFTAGYRDILLGLFFGHYLTGPAFDREYQHQAIGWRYGAKSVALYAWADVAFGMAGKAWRTLEAGWPFFLDNSLPIPAIRLTQLVPPPPASGAVLKSGEQIPRSGIWQPLDVPGACANYLIVGRDAPPARRACKRYDCADYPGGETLPPAPAHSIYEYATFPTRWQLVWEDKRYVDGKVPDESEYLDATTEPPPWPPRA